MEGPVITYCYTTNDSRNWILKWNINTENKKYILYDFDVNNMSLYLEKKIDVYELLRHSTEIHLIDLENKTFRDVSNDVKDKFVIIMTFYPKGNGYHEYVRNSYFRDEYDTEPVKIFKDILVNEKIKTIL